MRNDIHSSIAKYVDVLVCERNIHILGFSHRYERNFEIKNTEPTETNINENSMFKQDVIATLI